LSEIFKEFEESYGVKIPDTHYMVKLREDLVRSADKINEIVSICYNLVNSQYFNISDSLLRIALIEELKLRGKGETEGIILRLSKNLQNLRKHVAELGTALDGIEGGLRVMREKLTAELPNREKLKEAIRSDLDNALKNSLTDLEKQINSIARVVDKIGEMSEEHRSSIVSLRKLSEDIIARLSSLEEKVKNSERS